MVQFTSLWIRTTGLSGAMAAHIELLQEVGPGTLVAIGGDWL